MGYVGSPREQQRGFGIIEILIAVALVGGLIWAISAFVTSAQTQSRSISSGASCASAAQTVVDTFKSMGTRDNILPMVLDPNNLEARYRALPAAVRFQSMLPTGTQVVSSPVISGPSIYSSQLNLSTTTYLEILNNSNVDYCSAPAPLPSQLIDVPSGMTIQLQILPLGSDLTVWPCTKPLQTRPMGRSGGISSDYLFMVGHSSIKGYRTRVQVTTQDGKSCESSADFLHASDLAIAEAGGVPLVPAVTVLDSSGLPGTGGGGAFCPAPAEIDILVQFDVSSAFPGVDFESGSVPICRDPAVAGGGIWQPCSVTSLLSAGFPTISVSPSEPTVMRMRFTNVPSGNRRFQVATVDMAGNISAPTAEISVPVIAACPPPPTTTTTTSSSSSSSSSVTVSSSSSSSVTSSSSSTVTSSSSSTTSTTLGPDPVDCIGSWGACSASCGGGTQIFNITTPAANGGDSCLHPDGASRNCNEHSCPCESTIWEPDASTVCSPLPFTQTGDCGDTRASPDLGTKICTPCEETSWSPAPSTTCSGVPFTQTSNCGTTRAETGTRTPVWSPAAPLPSATLVCSGVTLTRTNDCGESESVTGSMLPNFVPEAPLSSVCPNQLVTENDANNCAPPRQVAGTKPSEYSPPLPNAATICAGQSLTQSDTCGLNPVTVVGTMQPTLPPGAPQPNELCVGESATVASANGCGDVTINGTRPCVWRREYVDSSNCGGVVGMQLPDVGSTCNSHGDGFTTNSPGCPNPSSYHHYSYMCE